MSHFDLAAAFFDKLLVVFDVIDAGERMLDETEQFAVFLLVEHVSVRVDVRVVERFVVEQVVSDLVGRRYQLWHACFFIASHLPVRTIQYFYWQASQY